VHMLTKHNRRRW